MNNSMLTEDEFREHIKQTADGYGSQKALAEAMHVTAAYLSDILSSKRSISDGVAQFFGRRLVKFYVIPVDGQSPALAEIREEHEIRQGD
jgi:transcriptional regulator with XRE-family HTH domain